MATEILDDPGDGMAFEDHLLTEARNPSSEGLDGLSAAEFVALMNLEDAKAVEAVRLEAPAIARAVEVVAERFREGGRLIYVGAGTSGRLGVLDASECPPTFNSSPTQVVGLIAGGPAALTRAVEGAEDDRDRGRLDIESAEVGPRDVVVGIATSGRTPYVLGAVEGAKARGAFAIGLACNRPSLLGALVDLEIAPLVGPEVLAGSTRLKSGTATKLVLNMLTTGAMVRIGKTMGNRMVDLQPTNEKLRIRSRRILREIAELDEPEAIRLLDLCSGRLKPALVVALAGVAPDVALLLLDRHDGQVRGAIAGRDRGKSRMSGPLYLGVDGGGTSTTAWLGDLEGRVLGRGVGGPSNAKAIGLEAARAGLDRSILAAFEDAGREVGPLAACCLGLAGFDRPEDKSRLQSWADESRWGGRLLLVNDGDLVIAAGTPEGWGVGLIAGTGSIAVGRDPGGRTARAGGWGHLIGDEGSGYAVALAALRRLARESDGRTPAGSSALADRICHRLGIGSTSELVRAIYRQSFDRASLASLAPAVVEASEDDPTLLGEILEPAGEDLARMVEAVVRNLEMEPTTLPLAMGGSFLLNCDRVAKIVLDRLALLGYKVSPARVPHPVEGALVLARRGSFA